MTKSIQTQFNGARPTSEVILKGAISATLGTFITQPLDVVKTRLQAAPVLSCHTSTGVVQTAVSLWKSTSSNPSRIRLFWAGTVPSLWRSVPGVCAYFSTINILRSYFLKDGSPALNAFFLGFTSRCVVGTILLPFVVVKSQAEAGLNYGRSTLASLRWIHSHSRWQGVFSGLLPTLARDSPYSGLYLLFYTQFKHLFIPGQSIGSEMSHSSAPTYLLCTCALLAASCATAVTQPADVLRSNRQLSVAAANLGGPPVPRLPWTRVLRETVRVDGVTGLWRGFSLRLARRGVFGAISWTLYDRIPQNVPQTVS